MRRIAITLIMAVIIPTAMLGRQTQPDVKRIHQIQAALVEHGYEAGKTWPQTHEILRSIARDHHWQTRNAPDARVLIILGLGNVHSDPQVTEEGHGHLDGE
jgi:hypothetical protein